MEEDKALKRIKLKKMREMFQRRGSKKEQETSASNKPIELTDITFIEAVQNHSFVVVDCWAPWCAPCYMIGLIIEELAQDYAGKILFGKLNIDQNRNITMSYHITSIPTLLVFKKGKLVDRVIGAMPRQILEPKIIRYL